MTRRLHGLLSLKVEYTQEELSALILKRSRLPDKSRPYPPRNRGTPLETEDCGTKRTLTIGKELEIRRTLHFTLYSSAFVVDKGVVPEGIPEPSSLTGAGWGHGVGLCQINCSRDGQQGV